MRIYVAVSWCALPIMRVSFVQIKTIAMAAKKDDSVVLLCSYKSNIAIVTCPPN